MQSVGFKEWALVCEALGRGRQTILLRKGGIAEGRDGFGFRHDNFFLFPTFFHEQVVKVRMRSAELPVASAGKIEVRYYAKLEAQKAITLWEQAAELEPLHILDESVVRERFEYKDAGLHVALVRVFRLEPAWTFPDKPAYGGFRLLGGPPPAPANTHFVAVLDDDQYKERLKECSALLARSAAR